MGQYGRPNLALAGLLVSNVEATGYYLIYLIAVAHFLKNAKLPLVGESAHVGSAAVVFLTLMQSNAASQYFSPQVWGPVQFI